MPGSRSNDSLRGPRMPRCPVPDRLKVCYNALTETKLETQNVKKTSRIYAI